MPRGPNGERRPGGTIGAAIRVAKIATGEIEEETPAHRKANVNGGKARADRMTPEKPSGLARKAAQARWNKTRVA